MEITFNVRRYDPEAPDPKPYWQQYQLEVESHFTVLDGLIKIREEIDGTLTLRCSCRSAICGSCAMRINGHAALACKTKIIDMTTEGGTVTVEPAGVMPVIKDLVVDMQLFWDKIRAVQPYLQPEGPEPEGEYLAPNEAMVDLAGAMNCIMCGACVSDCTVLEVDKTFLGPAALAKAYRFVGDPRDDHTRDRLELYSQPSGIWDCTHCFECVQVCPKGVAPMDRIMQIREKAVEAGFTDNNGTRHAKAFTDSVKKRGRLDELTLVPNSVGMLNITEQLGYLPGAIRMLRSGKLLEAAKRHKAEHPEKIRRIFDKLEKK